MENVDPDNLSGSDQIPPHPPYITRADLYDPKPRVVAHPDGNRPGGAGRKRHARISESGPITQPAPIVAGSRLVVLALAVLFVGINMRPAIVALAPELDAIQASTGVSNTVTGVLTTLPLLCFGVFAPMAPRLARRFGIEPTLLGVLILLLGGIVVRVLPTLIALFVGTALIGVAVAVANVVVTAIIKRDFAGRVGLMSGLHTTMLVGGGAVAAGLTVPIQHAIGASWEDGIAVWGVLAIAAIAFWVPRMRAHMIPRGTTVDEIHSRSNIWTSRLAWAVALFYAFQSLVYYTATTWLPTFFAAHGFTASAAGALLSLCFGCAIVTAVLMPVLADRSVRQGYLTIIGGALCLLGLLGLIAAPTAAAAPSAAVLGLGLGAMLSLGITFMSTRAASTHEAGLLSAMSQCVGYLVAAAGPVLFGVARDASGGWGAGLIALCVMVVPMTVAGFIAGRDGTITEERPRAR